VRCSKVAKKKTKKKTAARTKTVSRKRETEDNVTKFIMHEEEEVGKMLALATRELDDFLAHNAELKKLKAEVREKPLAYTALALTMGIAIGTLIKGGRD